MNMYPCPPHRVLREKGAFGTVAVVWQVFQRTQTLLPIFPQVDFQVVTGSVMFQDGQTTGYIELAVIADGIPELLEVFEVQLISATVLGDSSVNPSIDAGAFNSSVSVEENDDPFGLFGFSSDSQSVAVAEDVPSDNSFSGVVVLNITRGAGSFGTTSVRI